MSTITSTVGSLFLVPFTYTCAPIIRLLWLVFKHTAVVPTTIMFRTFLFAFVYVPLTPVLLAARISYDSTVPVEVWLYRLMVAFRPHVAVLLVHMLHHFIISLFMGAVVGVVAGFHINLVTRLFRIFKPAKTAKFTQTTLHFDRLVNKPTIELKERDILGRTQAIQAGLQDLSGTPNGPNLGRQVEIKREPVLELEKFGFKTLRTDPTPDSDQNNEKDPGSNGAHVEQPITSGIGVKLNRSANKSTAGFENTGQDPIAAIIRHLYEDDDGYELMDYDNQKNNAQVMTNRKSKQRRRSAHRPSDTRRTWTSGDTTIEKETKSDTSLVLFSELFEKSTSTKLYVEGLPTLASVESVEDDDAAGDQTSSAVTVQTETEKDSK